MHNTSNECDQKQNVHKELAFACTNAKVVGGW